MRAYLVEQRLDFLLLFALADLARICNLEELRGHFDKPLRFHCRHVMTVLPCRQDQLVIHQPFGRSVEQRRRRVDIDWCSFNQSLVPLLWVFLGGVSEKPRTNRSANEVVVTTSREDIMFVSKKL